MAAELSAAADLLPMLIIIIKSLSKANTLNDERLKISVKDLKLTL